MPGLRIICDGEIIEADLLEDDAPRICAYMRSVLPMDGTMVHAKFAGEETIVMVPFFAEQENPKLNVVAGDIGYYPGRQTICLFYGETKPFGEVSYFARVRSNLDGLARVGRRTLDVGHVNVRLESRLMARQTATELVEELRQFTATRWVGEPPDVQRLRTFSLPPMGNLPCVLYCNFDLFWAGEQLQVCRQAALEGDLRLPELTEVSALLLDRIAARTAKWDMTETVALMRRAASVLREWRPDTAQEFAIVIEHLMMAIDRIQSAVDTIIPWNELDKGVRLRAAP